MIAPLLRHLFGVPVDYCGCCGGELPVWNRSEWCKRCRPHVLDTGEVPMRTYYAQLGKECPYQDEIGVLARIRSYFG